MNTIPLFPIAIAYITGIILGRYIHLEIGWIYAICLVIVCLSMASFCWRKTAPAAEWQRNFRLPPLAGDSTGSRTSVSGRAGRWIQSSLFLSSAVMIGWLFYTIDSGLIPANHISHFTDCKGTITGNIIDSPQVYNNRTRFTVEAESIAAQASSLKVCGKLQVTLAWTDSRFRYGDRIRLIGKIEQPFSLQNPGGFDYRKALSHQKILACCRIQGNNQTPEIQRIGQARINPIITFSAMVKDQAVKSIYQLLPEPQSYFLDGVILGNRTYLPKHMQKWFADTGTLHILAVSGMNVALVVITFFFFFRLFRLNKRLAYLLNIPVVIIFCLVTGCVPSVMRASLMAIIFLLSRNLLERDIDIYQVIGLAALIYLVPYPQMVFDLSFQLSFLAVLGIIYLTPVISEKLLFFLPKWLSLTIATTLAAQLATTPLLACCFHRVSLISLASNAIVVPLVGLITPLGLISFGLNMVSYKLAWLAACLNSWLIILLLICVEFFASIPYASIPVATPSLMDIVSYYLVLITIRHVDRIGWRNAGLICLIAANLFLWEQVANNSRDRDELTCTFLDVEKGSAAYLELNSKKMLINVDVKEWDMECVVLPFLQGCGVRTLDAAIGDTGVLDREIKMGLKLGKGSPPGRISGYGMMISTDSRGVGIDYGRVRFLFPTVPVSGKAGYWIDSSGKQVILNVPTTRIARTLRGEGAAKVMIINRGCKRQEDRNPHVFRIKEKGAIVVTTDGKRVRVTNYSAMSPAELPLPQK